MCDVLYIEVFNIPGSLILNTSVKLVLDLWISKEMINLDTYVLEVTRNYTN